MSTKDNLPGVRYFTPLDPYHYTVDNRPLTDLRSNAERLAMAVDSEVAAKHLSTLAAGFAIRGYATENTAVGTVTYDGFDFIVNRAVLTQSKDASGTDTRDVPWIGLAQDAETFTLSAPLSANTVRPYIIKARAVAATTALPYYDSGLTDLAGFNHIQEIEWQLVQGADQSVDDPIVYPSAGAGWVECFRARIYDSSADVNPYLVTYVNFKDEGAFGGSGGDGTAFELQKFTHTLLTDSDTVTGITVNVNYAFIFVDGLLQPDFTILSDSSIQFPSTLVAGQTVDVLVTAGGQATLADTVHSRFEFTATADDQTVFSDSEMSFSADSAQVFVGGAFLPWTDYSFDISGQTLTLNTGVADGTKIYVFELRTVGVGLPHIPGGVAGDYLVKTGPLSTDYTWGSGVGISGGTEGDVLVKTGPLPTDLDWAKSAPHGTIRLDYVSLTGTVKLSPHGGGGIIVNGIRRVIPTAGVTCGEFTDSGWLSTAVANGFQAAMVWMGLSYNAGTDTFTLSPYLCSAHNLSWSNLGVPVLSTSSAVTIVGACRLIAGASRVLPLNNARNMLVRSFFGEFSTLASYTNTGATTTSGAWTAIGPTIITEPSGVAWHQAPLATLEQSTKGADTLYSQVRGLVLPGESYEVSFNGAFNSTGLSGDVVVARLNLSGIKYVEDSSGGSVYQPRLWTPALSTGQVSIRSEGSVASTATAPVEIFVLPEADVRIGSVFRTGYSQTTFKVIK